MFATLTYPLDVIKTNRILQTSLAKEGAERIPREILSLQEKGNLQHGLFRGLLATLIAANIAKQITDKDLPLEAALLGTVVVNPLNIIQVHKQVLHNTVESKTYAQIMKDTMGNRPWRIFTLGLIPTLVRNSILFFGITPAVNGIDYTPVSVLYGLGGILLSHPFEIARVQLQYLDTTSTFGGSLKIIKGVFAIEGLGGLYRGAVPRVLNILPPIVSYASYQRYYYLVSQEQLE
ncbi:UNKNOWN [Stylonychia lemnae]|uniref:Mitochondrial carrier protein n=1 Tax=Stylonychia lemnae TaxID=5949 RepID=A0A077ZNR5_STYLE|nr:UNKNOWN [Stylonychia lemnae]|eukprot:CDW71114.1 UNKNOWN [Stylonychia lemnae]